MSTIATINRRRVLGAALTAAAVLTVASGAWASGDKPKLKLPIKPVTTVTESVPSLDAGHLTGLIIAPQPGQVGQTISVKFTGKGVCDGASVIMVASAGNGPGGLKHEAISPVFPGDAPWPRVAAFVPTKKGNHWIYMAPPDDPTFSDSIGCYGAPAGAQNMANIQMKMEIKPADDVGTVTANTCTGPMVKTLVVGGKVKPGDAVIIGGCGFGKQKGEVRLVGDFPDGFVKLKIDTWAEGGIGAFVPKGVTGAPDQTATIQVIALNGGKSNKDKGLFFEARRERVLVSYIDTENNCKKKTGLYGLEFESTCAAPQQNYQGKACGYSVCAVQKGKPVINKTLSYGDNDDFAIVLKNGFVYDGNEFWSNSGADVAFPYTPPVGPKPVLKVLKKGDKPKLRVVWEAFRPTGWVEYKLKIFVVGPAGVPYS